MSDLSIVKDKMSLESKLKVYLPNEEILSFRLKDGINYIGRLTDAREYSFIDIMIPDEKGLISRKHCQIEVKFINGKTAYTLKDTESKNGTYLLDFSKKPLDPRDEILLINNDRILLGDEIILMIIIEEIENLMVASKTIYSKEAAPKRTILVNSKKSLKSKKR